MPTDQNETQPATDNLPVVPRVPFPDGLWYHAEKIESYVTLPECEFLWDHAMAVKTKLIVEVGSWLGRSSVVLASACKHAVDGPCFVAVDTWVSCDMAPGQDFYSRWRESMIKAGHIVNGKFELQPDDGVYSWAAEYDIGVLRMPSVVAARLYRRLLDLPKGAEGKIGLLFIDADHSYQSVKEDFQAWYPNMAPDGVVILHDINCGHDGPRRLFRELGTRFRTRAHGEHNIGAVYMDGWGRPAQIQ